MGTRFDIRRSIDLKKPLTGKQIVEAFRAIAEDLAPRYEKFFYRVDRLSSFISRIWNNSPHSLVRVTDIKNIDGERSAVYGLPLKSHGHDARLTDCKSERIFDNKIYEKIEIRTCDVRGGTAFFDKEEEVTRLMDEAKSKLEEQLAKA